MVEFKEVEQGPEDGSVDDDIDSLLSGVGKRMLFEERPVGLTALFRFQTGSDIFYGELGVGFPVNACMCRMREKRERERKRERGGLHSVIIDAWCFVQRDQNVDTTFSSRRCRPENQANLPRTKQATNLPRRRGHESWARTGRRSTTSTSPCPR